MVTCNGRPGVGLVVNGASDGRTPGGALPG